MNEYPTGIKKLLIVFGSFVNGSENPSDIDILQLGMTRDEINKHIKREFNISDNELSFDIHNFSKFDKEFKIPVPCDSQRTNYKIVYYEPQSVNELPVKIHRCTDNLVSVLRDETKTVWDIIQYLNDDSKFGWKGIPVNIGEFDGGNPACPDTFSNDYLNGRISLVNTVNKHLGKDKFGKVCDGLWWGKLLHRIYLEKPTEKGFNEIRKFSPIGAGPNSASFWVKNTPRMIGCTHGFSHQGESAVEKFIQTLYDQSK